MARLTRNIYSIEGLEHPLDDGFFVYAFEEGPRDLTLVDTCFIPQLPKLESLLQDQGHDLGDVKRMVLTHVHGDHIQAANEIRKVSGARIYSHWAEASYLKKDPPYRGPPSMETLQRLTAKSGKPAEETARKFGNRIPDEITVDQELTDGDEVGRLKVIHTPGHTPGHVSLYSEEDRAVIGGDCLFKSILGMEGLFLSPREVTMDPVAALMSVRRLSRLNFDKLLLAHQDSPLLENARAAVEKLAENSLIEDAVRIPSFLGNREV